ncbi:MAG: HDOD domain-containing protein [Rhodoferax sp.]|jgi:hypothetical protein|nr:HDOD domain-containing protein [Rhodoferax sp.]
MTAGVLHHVALGCQLLWNVQRQVAGVRLELAPHQGSAIDASHLLASLGDIWPLRAAPLLLATPSASLLAGLLDLSPAKLARIEVTDALLQEHGMAQRVMRAQQRGLSLVWRGEPGSHCKAAYAGCFSQSILTLSTDDALAALRIALRQNRGHDAGPVSVSPVQRGQIYQAVASRVLADHCLNQQGATLLGWPVEDVLHGYRQTRIQPDHAVMTQLVRAIDADAAMEQIEQLMGQDALLAYRFLRFINSAGVGLRREVDALRPGLMVLGLGRVKSWLQEQMRHVGGSDLNLQPIRHGMTLRARLMAELLDAGEGDALKRELYLCGLLSQIDLLLGEPLADALASLPLSERVNTALLSHDGPYWPYLAMAAALECPGSNTATEALCECHGFDLEDVNLALLRTLAAATAVAH